LVKPEATKLLNATTGVVLLGTPHRGTDNVTASELLQRIIHAGVRGEGASLTALQADNEMILDAVQGFATTAREKNISVHCFFEQRSSKVSKMFGDAYKVGASVRRGHIFTIYRILLLMKLLRFLVDLKHMGYHSIITSLISSLIPRTGIGERFPESSPIFMKMH
jgi:hypothetical protein